MSPIGASSYATGARTSPGTVAASAAPYGRPVKRTREKYGSRTTVVAPSAMDQPAAPKWVRRSAARGGAAARRALAPDEALDGRRAGPASRGRDREGGMGISEVPTAPISPWLEAAVRHGRVLSRTPASAARSPGRPWP